MSKPVTELLRMSVVDIQRVNADARTIDLVLVTETPVEVFDVQRMEVLDEIIRVDGVEIPKQIPMVDSHNRETVSSVRGSIRDLKRGEVAGIGPAILGRAYFGADAESVRTFEAYRDGHLTDFSVGATRGEVKYEGGKRIVTRSKLVEGSTVIRGADPNAKAVPASLRAYTDPQGALEDAMNEALKQKLIARGLPADADEKATLDFIEKLGAEKPIERNDDGRLTVTVTDLVRKLEALEATRAEEAKAAKELARRNEIESLCRKHGVADDVQRGYIDGNKSMQEVAQDILNRKAEAGVPIGAGPISFGQSDKEKFYSAARDSLVQRAVQASGIKPHAALERAKLSGDAEAIQRCTELTQTFEKPSLGTREMRNVGPMELARMFCERSGVRTFGLPNQEIAQRAIQLDGFINRASEGPAYNTTASFSNLMLDAANKTLLAAYDEAEVTYPMWTRQAPSAADFKTLNRIRFGELPDPEIVPENGEYPEKPTSDAKESYRVEKYGELFSISMEAIVNDDLNAISRIPAMQGTAMRRKINKVVYAILTGNPTMSDGVALFHASSHNGNLDATALADTALNIGYVVMMTQTGLTTGTVLNIMPRYLIVPPSLAETAIKIVTSSTPPSAGGSAVGTSGITNPYGPGGMRPLQVVTDGQISASQSATAWWLAASPSQVDTIEVTFLRGEESPVLEREMGFKTDSIIYKIRQTFAAAAIDYRGLYQGNS